MKFIDRLFPFSTKEIFNENILTAYWVIVLIAIFLSALILSCVKTSCNKKKYRNKQSPNTQKIGKIWKAYVSSFTIYGEVKKTKEFSENYFNEQNILLATLNLRVVNNVPNTLIGLGILGTFVGLTYGIADSNFELQKL